MEGNLLAFFENCVERATALAATCGWLAFGGGAEAAVGVAIGGAGLAAVVSDTVRRHGPESEAALKSIRKRIAADLGAHAKVERWDTRADLEAADDSMERALAGCFLDRKALAASARSPEGFPGSATTLILARLAEREPATFGKDGPRAARDFADLVVRTALEAAIENESYFKNLQPHLLMETLRGLGTVEERVDEVHGVVTRIQGMVAELHSNRSNEIRDLVGRISTFMRHTLPSRLDSPMARQGTPAITRELLQEIQYLRELYFRMTASQSQQAEAFIQEVVGAVNDIVATIKSEAGKPSPDMRRVNETHESVVSRLDQYGKELCKHFD